LKATGTSHKVVSVLFRVKLLNTHAHTHARTPIKAFCCYKILFNIFH